MLDELMCQTAIVVEREDGTHDIIDLAGDDHRSP